MQSLVSKHCSAWATCSVQCVQNADRNMWLPDLLLVSSTGSKSRHASRITFKTFSCLSSIQVFSCFLWKMGLPAHSREFETRWWLQSTSNQAVLCFYDSITLRKPLHYCFRKLPIWLIRLSENEFLHFLHSSIINTGCNSCFTHSHSLCLSQNIPCSPEAYRVWCVIIHCKMYWTEHHLQ